MHRLLPHVLVLALAALLLSGCNFTQLAYDHLDFLARRYVAGFVDLNPSQTTAFDNAFGRLWRWHRRSELPKYAAAARGLGVLARAPQTPEQMRRQLESLDALGRALSQQLLGEVAPLLTQLDDAQVQQILAETDHRIDKAARRSTKLDDAHWRSRQLEELSDGLEKYAGSLTPPQVARLQRWAQSLHRDEALNQRAARAWRDHFAAVLTHRQDPDLASRAQELADLHDPDIAAFERSQSARRELDILLFADLTTAFTAPQRDHLQTSLNAFAADLETLAAEMPNSP